LAWKFNPFTGQLDLVGSGSSGSGDVVGPASATDNAIARYDGTTGKLIQDSKTLVQDGGGIEAQGFITNKLITDTIVIHANQVMVTSGFSIELTGELVIEADGELVLV
jgi:hypothetical protein